MRSVRPVKSRSSYSAIMQDFGQAFALALQLIISADPALSEIIFLSLSVSLSAVAIASVIGLGIGATVGIVRFPGRGALIVFLNALMGLPPVVVGLLVYMALSHAGPLGWLHLLYTPTAMIIAHDRSGHAHYRQSVTPGDRGLPQRIPRAIRIAGRSAQDGRCRPGVGRSVQFADCGPGRSSDGLLRKWAR